MWIWISGIAGGYVVIAVILYGWASGKSDAAGEGMAGMFAILWLPFVVMWLIDLPVRLWRWVKS